MPTNPARLLGRPIPMLVLAAAVAIGTFSGVAYAATRSSARPVAADLASTATARTSSATARPVFHPLKLMNGWQAAPASWDTGIPRYAVSAEGVVYLAGGLVGGRAGVPAFRLPAGARPGYYDCFAIFSSTQPSGNMGALHIYASGLAYLDGGQVTNFSSLSGVSFVVGY